jgi:hypothetical protein
LVNARARFCRYRAPPTTRCGARSPAPQPHPGAGQVTLVGDLMSLISRLARSIPSIALSSAAPSEPNASWLSRRDAAASVCARRCAIRIPWIGTGLNGLRVGQHAGPAVPVAASGIRNTRLRLVDGEHPPRRRNRWPALPPRPRRRRQQHVRSLRSGLRREN